MKCFIPDLEKVEIYLFYILIILSTDFDNVDQKMRANEDTLVFANVVSKSSMHILETFPFFLYLNDNFRRSIDTVTVTFITRTPMTHIKMKSTGQKDLDN